MDTDICEIKEYFDSGTISDEISALILNDFQKSANCIPTLPSL